MKVEEEKDGGRVTRLAASHRVRVHWPPRRLRHPHHHRRRHARLLGGGDHSLVQRHRDGAAAGRGPARGKE